MKKYQSGFTLIELMIVVTIAAILATVAVPSFQNTIKRNRVETQIRSFSEMLKLARSEAVSTQRFVTVCNADNTGLCGTSAVPGWSNGWSVFYDDDLGGDIDTPATDLLKIHDEINDNVLTVRNDSATNIPIVRFNRLGATTAGTALLVKICDSGNDSDYVRALIIEPSGVAVRSTTDLAGVALACP